MRMSELRRCAGTLVAVLTAALLLPVATLAGAAAPSPEKHGCHCTVKMACCEAGLCHGEIDTEPSSGSSWSGCRDEAPDRTAVPSPSTTFETALLVESFPRAETSGVPLSFPPVRLGGLDGPAPALPPPRISIASR